MSHMHHQLDDSGALYPQNSLHSLQAVPLKGLPAIVIVYIAFGKNLVSLEAFHTFLSVMILSLPLRGTIPLGGKSYTTPRQAQQRDLQVNSLAPPVLFCVPQCRVS